MSTYVFMVERTTNGHHFDDVLVINWCVCIFLYYLRYNTKKKREKILSIFLFLIFNKIIIKSLIENLWKFNQYKNKIDSQTFDKISMKNLISSIRIWMYFYWSTMLDYYIIIVIRTLINNIRNQACVHIFFLTLYNV
jgi:hypothetical protein